jgi:hypothetical protein
LANPQLGLKISLGKNMAEPNPPENRNINTEGGNYNERIEGDYNVFQNIFNIFSGQTTTPVGNPARPKNERILLAEVKQEVTLRLRQSLHNAVLINLGKESQPQQVKRPWDAEIKIGLKPPQPLPDTTTILEVFDSQEVAGKLLILGAPGAGKTTTQLELAQALVSCAEEQPEYPVPVLFNLSSWKNDRQFLTDWLVAELKSKYGVSIKLGKEWVENRQLLPMLDGLDELEPQRQEPCVNAINQFLTGETKPLSLVVCSRIEEYSNYKTQLQLNGAVYLQPLTNNQICNYLTSINSLELWSTISSDLDLLELVKTPLLLSISVLASQEISVEKWQHLNSTANRIQYLLDAYIGRMLTRNINSGAYSNNKTPNAKQTRMWLVWLAQQIQRESKTEFLIEEMQPNWLSKTQKSRYRLILGLIGWGIGVMFGLLYNQLILIVIFGLVGGMIFWDKSGEIKLKERISFIKLNKENRSFLVIVVLLNMLLCLIIRHLYSSLISTVSMFFTYLYISHIKAQPDLVIENKKITTQGIFKSAYNAILGFISGFILGFILSFIFDWMYWWIEGERSGLISLNRILGHETWLSSKLDQGLLFDLYLGLFVGVILGITYGGITCIQHFVLRLILYYNGYIPWNYARFLNYCTERLFLQRVGGRYRFIHKLLQDQFAQMEFRRH